MVIREVVGAHYGLKDWLAQRVTALYMAVFTLVFAICAFTLPRFDYESWSGLFSAGWMKFATFIFMLCLFYHVWVGVRDIWMDYVKSAGLRLVLHMLTMFALIGYAGWGIQILWRL